MLVAALGDTMLGIAGRMASGTVTWMTGPATIEAHTVPTIRAAAAEGGRPEPQGGRRPTGLRHRRPRRRQGTGRALRHLRELPSYRAMLDREGAAGPADVAIVGHRLEVVAQILRFADIGTTDFTGAPFGSGPEIKASIDVLAGLVNA